MNTKIDKIVHSYNTNNPFQIPDGYFEQLHEKVMERLPEKDVKPVAKKITLWENVRPFLYVAAALTGIYFSITLLTNQEQFNHIGIAQSVEQQVDGSQWASVQVTEQEFFQFIEDQLSEFRFREMLIHFQN